MSGKQSKRRRAAQRVVAAPTYDDEYQVSFRLPNSPRDTAIILQYVFYKFACLEGGRLVGRRSSDGGFETILGMLNEESANRAIENIESTLEFSVAKWRIPKGTEGQATIEPIGFFFSEEENDEILFFIKRDQDIKEDYLKSIAARMESGEQGDFVIPDLSPEEYKEAKAIAARKSN